MPVINVNNRNQYALITGATSGFGYELAKLFARDGFSLVLVARSIERLQEVTNELKQQYSVEVTPISADLFQPAAAKEIYDEVKARGIVVSYLVNDAGQGEWGRFIDVDLQRSLDIIQLNVCSLVALTKYFATEMVARGEGHILQLGSEAGKAPMPLLSVYAATKAFVISFSAAISNELEGTGVNVTVLLPGAADTDFFHKANMEHTKTYREDSLQTPEEVAQDGYEALMSGESRVISGGKTKMHVYMANLLSDEANAVNMRKLMEPSEKEDGRTASDHGASRRERASIGRESGDLKER
ncbi:SDR family NAD(P)-dependent oxidoreductase [Chitinophaga filiformis]|uniref:SDR family oxidoreductase n=1 Tax=Chitinophaga filiformis TaxID=104663 RepID=A0ABY4I921_CHIFI|nr:SDR family oxidoreductase [Chitinophaga filiformis]UPK72592.1 SDR family oxidoreductase [Chitinophaga filiformis]